MSVVAILQNIITFVTSTLGITLVTVALGLGLAAVMCRMMYWHTLFEIMFAGALLIGLAATVNQIYG